MLLESRVWKKKKKRCHGYFLYAKNIFNFRMHESVINLTRLNKLTLFLLNKDEKMIIDRSSFKKMIKVTLRNYFF